MLLVATLATACSRGASDAEQTEAKLVKIVVSSEDGAPFEVLLGMVPEPKDDSWVGPMAGALNGAVAQCAKSVEKWRAGVELELKFHQGTVKEARSPRATLESDCLIKAVRGVSLDALKDASTRTVRVRVSPQKSASSDKKSSAV